MGKEEHIKKRQHDRIRLRKQQDRLSGFIDIYEDGPETYVEQHHQSPNWVSVRLSQEMFHTHTDAEIMGSVVRAIGSKRAILGDRCLYQPGNRTVSFPIRQRKSLEGHWGEAMTVAKRMLNKIQEERWFFDRHSIFVGGK